MNQKVSDLIRELKQIVEDANKDGPIAIDVDAYMRKALEQLGVDA